MVASSRKGLDEHIWWYIYPYKGILRKSLVLMKVDPHGLAWGKRPWCRHWKQVEKLHVYFDQLLFETGFLNLGMADSWARSLSGLGLPGASHAVEQHHRPPPTRCQGQPPHCNKDNRQCFQMLPKAPEGWSGSQNHPQLRITGLKYWFTNNLVLHIIEKSPEGPQ